MIVKAKEQELLETKASVNEKKEELEQKIFEKGEVFQTQEKKLSSQLNELNDEIRNLEEILKKKKNEAKILSIELEKAQELLSVCMEEFEEESKEVEDAERVVEKDLQEIIGKKSELESEEAFSLQTYSEFIESYNSRTNDLRNFKEQLDLLEEEVKKIKLLQENRVIYLEKIKDIENILNEKEELLWDAQEYYSSNKDSIDSFKDFIRQQEEKVREIDKRIPILENDKKAAASSKQFKVRFI